MDVGKKIKTASCDLHVLHGEEGQAWLDDEEMHGIMMRSSDGGVTIGVSDKLDSEDLKGEIFWEEVMHGVLHYEGHLRAASSEPLVRCIARHIHAILKKNPKVRKLYGG